MWEPDNDVNVFILLYTWQSFCHEVDGDVDDEIRSDRKRKAI